MWLTMRRGSLCFRGWLFWFVRLRSIHVQAAPAIPRGNTGVGPPRLGDAVRRFAIRKVLESVKFLNRAAYAEIGVRKDIQSSEREDQKHLCRPHANAFDLYQRFDHCLVGKPANPIQR